MVTVVLIALRILTLVVFVTVLSSCKTNFRLTKADLDFNPYKAGDTLLFQSDKGERDTLIVHSTDKQVLREKCYSFLTCIYSNLTTDSWEGFYVNTNRPNETWTGKNIMTIRAEPNGMKTIYFDIYVKNAWWYGDSETNLEKVKSMTEKDFQLRNQTLTDVLEIKSENKEYVERSDFIEKIYWSKSLGLVGFDKLNGDKWTVTKK